MRWEDDVLTEFMGGSGVNDEPEDATFVFDTGSSASRAPASTAQSYMLVRERTGETFRVTLPAVIGRGTQATTKVSGNLAISRTHARLSSDSGRLMIEDLGSVNGTKVRGKRIPKHAPAEVHVGDEIGLASEVFHISVGE